MFTYRSLAIASLLLVVLAGAVWVTNLLDQESTSTTTADAPVQSNPAQSEAAGASSPTVSSAAFYDEAIEKLADGDRERAIALLESAIAASPTNEQAYRGLIDIYLLPDGDLQVAERYLSDFRKLFPADSAMDLRHAQTLRKLGKATIARSIVSGLVDNEVVSFEAAELEFDLGNYAKSFEILQQIGATKARNVQELVDGAFQFALGGDGGASAERVNQFSTVALAALMADQRLLGDWAMQLKLDRVARLRRFVDLRSKSLVYPNDAGLQAAIQSLTQLPDETARAETPIVGSADQELVSKPGFELYREMCASCHGIDGDGQGSASTTLFPSARNFQAQPMKIVSAVNRLATDADLRKVIRGGLSGSSMPAFDQLTDSEVDDLVAVVRYFQERGSRQRWKQMQREQTQTADGDAADQTEMDAYVVRQTVPSEALRLKEFLDIRSTRQADLEALADQGKELFKQTGCVQCHPLAEGEANAMRTQLFDDSGQPTLPRGLTREWFLGGDSFEEIVKRVVLGIPGTPHPGMENGDRESVAALAEYVVSIRPENPIRLTNHQRRVRANVGRASNSRTTSDRY